MPGLDGRYWFKARSEIHTPRLAAASSSAGDMQTTLLSLLNCCLHLGNTLLLSDLSRCVHLQLKRCVGRLHHQDVLRDRCRTKPDIMSGDKLIKNVWLVDLIGRKSHAIPADCYEKARVEDFLISLFHIIH